MSDINRLNDPSRNSRALTPFIVVMNLRHVDPNSLPGITRKKVRHGWGYWNAKGERITDRGEIERLNKIALPPAYERAWFCPHPSGHIQAIGYDARGRRQYRYHLDFRAKAEAEKYDLLADFGRALPKLRKLVEADLKGRPDARDTVIAAVVRLLDLERIRVGSEEYAKKNKSFGATTLRNRHAKLRGSRLSLEYKGKSGVTRQVTLGDKGLLRVVRRVHDLPGQHLFQYLNADGTACPVGSSEVNAYIKDAMGAEFSAKHFRTWHASVIALEHIAERVKAGEKPALKTLLEPVAAALGNTPAIARKSYVHPLVIGLAQKGYETLTAPRATQWLSGVERALIALLDAAGNAAEDDTKAA